MAGDGYVFGRGYLESTRLNYQNYLWHDAIGYSLHPDILARAQAVARPTCSDSEKEQAGSSAGSSTRPPFRIADIATGTGIWLSTIAAGGLPSSRASVELDGYDISAAQFPHPDSLPSTVRLSTLDASQPPPAHLLGRYNAVHVRLLLGVVDNGDPRPFLRHARALLAPGGILQWDEMDPAALRRRPGRVVRDGKGGGGGGDVVVTEAEMPCLDRLAATWKSAKDVSWVPRLAQIFEEEGNLEVLTNEAYTERQTQRQAMMDVWCLVADDFAAGLPADKAEGLKKISAGAYKEAMQGSYYSQTFRIVTARLKE